MAADALLVTVLPDGSVKVETDKVSAANHMAAEAFLRDAARLAGGTCDRRSKRGLVGAMLHAGAHLVGHNHAHG